jgi:hypothetical protein
VSVGGELVVVGDREDWRTNRNGSHDGGEKEEKEGLEMHFG